MMPWYWKCLPRKCLVKVRLRSGVGSRLGLELGLKLAEGVPILLAKELCRLMQG